MSNLLSFLSDFPFFQSEKNLVFYLEDFLAKEYLIRPLLVYSTQGDFKKLELNKCRSMLGRSDRLKLYSEVLLQNFVDAHDDVRKTSAFCTKNLDGYYYYLNLGHKRGQFYFCLFSTPQEISSEILVHLSQFVTNHLKFLEKFDDLYKSQELIHIDDVTGLYNQRKLYKDLANLVDTFQQLKDPFCVLFIDIDHFKKVNDNYGHLVGTKLLENVAKDIKTLLRDSDISYRYGGDEFVIILVNSNGESGKIVGERILQKIRSQEYNFQVKNEKKSIKLSVSIGVAEFPSDARNSEEILAIADRMMYEAKESGRGLVFNTQDVFKSSLKKMIQQK